MLALVQRYVGLMLLLIAAPLALAQAESPSPDQVIQKATDELLSAVVAARPTFANDPEPFYQEIKDIVLPLMDSRSFARGVMGKYGSSSAYRALETKAEKDAFKARIIRFSGVFQDSVVRTYAKGLMAFNGQNIEVAPLTDEQQSAVAEGGRVEILQLIERENDDPYELRYSFARNKKGAWLVRNMLVDGINLGRVYQSQFAQAVLDNGGDVDAAIDNWAVTLGDIDNDDESEQAALSPSNNG